MPETATPTLDETIVALAVGQIATDTTTTFSEFDQVIDNAVAWNNLYADASDKVDISIREFAKAISEAYNAVYEDQVTETAYNSRIQRSIKVVNLMLELDDQVWSDRCDEIKTTLVSEGRRATLGGIYSVLFPSDGNGNGGGALDVDKVVANVVKKLSGRKDARIKKLEAVIAAFEAEIAKLRA